MYSLSLLQTKSPTASSCTMEFWTIPRTTQVTEVVVVLTLLVLLSTNGVESRKARANDYFHYSAISCRTHSASLTDFGGVGDGTTSNTKAFQAAINQLSQYASDGGSQLFVPAGKWLTGSFNLTSHFTLFLHKDAVLLASQEESEWAVIDPLPSYGRGRDTDGGRFISLIFGTNLTDVVITGDNGTIDGQGALWWEKFHNKKLKYTRPYLIEIMYSDKVQISNLTLLNSPSWNVHPVYSSNVLVQGITILAPVNSPNTDGINPDSCTNTRIEDCYIVSGDDCVAVKSGWDEYGIAYGMPTKQLVIRRLTCISPTSAVIALGSEMSGGIQDVRAEDIVAINSESGVRIKTAVGRGGFVKDIYVRGMTMNTMKWAFWMTGNYGSHADNNYDPNALPVIQNVNYRDVIAENVTMAARLEGISGAPFTGICMSNVTIKLAKKAKKVLWNCTDVAGISSAVVPQPCDLLPDQGVGKITSCDFPEESLPIDNVQLQMCGYQRKYF
ncbi:probable polygalacturonase [Quercus robur]|uniref:probable polygalacturonase n=1 Tax=Quercus robur TaxID=38942 RepID=UPI0021628E99|nr:probable polygalacturonase [Quercus robur]